MQLVHKNILIISPQAWGINFVSKHHYAEALAKRNNQIFFLNPPTRKSKVEKVQPHIFSVDYKPLFRGISHLPPFFSQWATLIEYKHLIKEIGTDIDVIWNFDSSRFFNLNKIIKPLKICHIVDYNENFQRELLSETSDFCFCTSEFIKHELIKYNPSTWKIHHGYQLHNDNSQLSTNLPFSKNKVKAAYVGNLAIKYIDWTILSEITDTHQEIDFYFIGNTSTSNLGKVPTRQTDEMNKLEAKKNTHFLGPKPANQLQSYLQEMDILLLTYKAGEYLKQLANPHKMMEYLGSGKIVVSTYTDEYKNDHEIIEMTKDNSEFSGLFNNVVENLDAFNSEQNQQQRKNFAERHSYLNQINKIENFIRSFQNLQHREVLEN